MATGAEAVTSRQLMNRILAALFAQGWILNLSTDISKCTSDLDTLLFRHQVPTPAPCEWLAISFSNSNEIRFLWDITKQQHYDPVVDAWISVLGSALKSHNPHKKVPGCHQLELKGRPWRAYGEGSIHARILLLQFLTTLEQHGWTIYASIDQKLQRGNDNPSGDTDTWHCCKPTGWQPGMPVFHK